MTRVNYGMSSVGVLHRDCCQDKEWEEIAEFDHLFIYTYK